jgi:methylmalonyl-CoA epimerase
MTLEHLGIAVADADAAVALFARLLGAAPYKRETVEREGVRTVFFGDGGQPDRAPKLELLEALSPDSPVAKHLEKRGPGLHHVAFEVEDLEAAMARLAGLGFQLLADAPKPGADGKRIVFLHPKSTAGVLVELCETVAAPAERLAVPFEGGTLAASVSGPVEAPPLVVLHGALGHSGGETAPLVRRWQRRFRVYALDFMAHGASDAFADRPLSVEGFVANVLALLDAAGLSRAAVFGYSMGGGVALHAAARHPGRFARLAVQAAYVQWQPDEVARLAAASDVLRSAPDGPWHRTMAEAHRDGRWPALARRMRAFTAALPDQALSDEALAALPHPTLVSCGDRDLPFLLRHAFHLRETLPNAALAVLPGLAHGFRPDDAPAFADLVARHLLGE